MNRKMPLRKIFMIAIILLVAFLLLVFALFKILNIRFPEIKFVYNGSSTQLKWNESLNLKQTENKCAAYSIMAYRYVLKNELTDADEIYNSIGKKDSNGNIYPWILRDYLKSNDEETNIYWIGHLSETDLKNWIIGKLENGYPIIILIGNKKIMHYIVILGYKDDDLMIYDSNYTRNANDDESGNFTVPMKSIRKAMLNSYFGIIPIHIAITQ
jgi:hypothetical protein